MKLSILKAEAAYERALKQLEKVFNAPANSTKSDQAELLMLLIEEYDSQHYPTNP